MARTFSYVIEHDYGFAPNPYWGVCSLANCKPMIRKVAAVGDIVMGTGSTGADLQGRLVYWMRVSEVITFDEYWRDSRFKNKRPVLNGSKMQHFGDNIYFTRDDGTIFQEDSFHSEQNGALSIANLVRDTSTTNRVLLGSDFAYFGKKAPLIPPDLKDFVKKGPGHKSNFSEQQQASMLQWINEVGLLGVIGEPARW